MSQQTILPFETGTRRRGKTLPPMLYVDGQSQSVELPPVGYLAGMDLYFSLTLKTAGALSFQGEALVQKARALISRIRLESNTSAKLVNASAHGLYLMSFLDERFAHNSGVLTGQNVDAPSSAGTHTLYFRVRVPAAANSSINYQLGLVNLQNDDVKVNLHVDFGRLASVFTNISGVSEVSGSILPVLHYFDVPNPAAYTQPTLDYIVSITETVESVTIGTGEHVYGIPRGNTLAQMIHEFTEDNAPLGYRSPVNPGGKIGNHELRMQGSATDYDLPAYVMAAQARALYGQDLPGGVVVLDALDDTGRPGQFDLGYQLIETDQFTQLQSITGLTGTNPNTTKCRTIRREFVYLA